MRIPLRVPPREVPMIRTILPLLLASSALMVALVYSGSPPQMPDQAKLQAMAKRFAPVDIGADISGLPASERQALTRLVQAAWIMDGLFLRQVWAGNETMLLYLLKDDSPLGRARLQYFLLNKGPWSRLDDNEPILSGLGPKPPGANFYPAGATKEELLQGEGNAGQALSDPSRGPAGVGSAGRCTGGHRAAIHDRCRPDGGREIAWAGASAPAIQARLGNWRSPGASAMRSPDPPSESLVHFAKVSRTPVVNSMSFCFRPPTGLLW